MSTATPASRECIPSVEARVRRVVADCLGTSVDELSGDVSLTEDLAADSLDLVELAVALEAEFRIALSDVVLDEMRTYRDLVDAIDALVRAGPEVEAERDAPRVVARSVLAPPARQPGGVFARTDG